MQKEIYRHEYKYICNSVQNAVLKMRTRGLLKVDKHASDKGYYYVRSLYFDSINDNCYYENEIGIDQRDKYRLRIYNSKADIIHLEKKSKCRQMTLKKSCMISREICEQLIRGSKVIVTDEMSQEQKELIMELQVKNLRPVVIVEYQRFPYVERNGNVRITFDENIRTSNSVDSFLDENIVTRPIMEAGKFVLEIKWDEFLPSYIKSHIQIDGLQWSSFSKYYLCRKYNTYGGIRT